MTQQKCTIVSDHPLDFSFFNHDPLNLSNESILIQSTLFLSCTLGNINQKNVSTVEPAYVGHDLYIAGTFISKTIRGTNSTQI